MADSALGHHTCTFISDPSPVTSSALMRLILPWADAEVGGQGGPAQPWAEPAASRGVRTAQPPSGLQHDSLHVVLLLHILFPARKMRCQTLPLVRGAAGIYNLMFLHFSCTLKNDSDTIYRFLR